MKQYRVTLTAKFSEDDLKRALGLNNIQEDSVVQSIRNYLSEGKNNMERLENVIVKQVMEDDLVKDLLS